MALMYHTSPLVASTGREFSRATTYSNPNDLRKAKKEAMKRLGIDFLEGMDDDAMDWEAELGNGNGNSTPDSETATKKEEGQNDQDLLKSEALREEVVSPTTPRETEPETPSTAGLSARELNRLKRKRKGGGAAVIAVAPPKSTPDSKYSTSMARDSSPKYAYYCFCF
jgi:TATA-binding protein-associated factor